MIWIFICAMPALLLWMLSMGNPHSRGDAKGHVVGFMAICLGTAMVGAPLLLAALLFH